jgi:hypothetical protein
VQKGKDDQGVFRITQHAKCRPIQEREWMFKKLKLMNSQINEPALEVKKA